MSLDPTYLFLSISFGLIGMAAFRYGKKESSLKHLMLAVALMAFPYFVSDLWAVLGIGTVLTVLLFWPN